MTAVEWLIKELNLEGYDYTIEQAKQMEKQQIIDAYNAGDENGYQMAHSHNDKYCVTAEEYLQELNK